MIDLLKEYTLLLASKSPRRQQLISKLGFDVEVVSIDADEVIVQKDNAKSITEFKDSIKYNNVVFRYGKEDVF